MKIFKKLSPITLPLGLSTYWIAFVIWGLFLSMNYYLNLSLEPIKYYDLEGKLCVEKWKDIVGYEGSYQISNLGRMKSLDREINHNYGGKALIKGRIRKQTFNQDGYLCCTLCKNCKIRVDRIHRLVALHFVPNPFGKPEVNHEDGNKLNNQADNFKWVTGVENIEHAISNGLRDLNGEKNHKAKLTTLEVLYIRNSLEDSITLSKMFKISRGSIYSIKNKVTWKHI